MRRLVIELLSLENGKAYGFHEYIFNLLNYFYQHREKILYDKIIIWCKDASKSSFVKFEDKFEILDFSYESYLKRHWLQSYLPIKYQLNKQDLLFSPGNISGIIKRSSEILTIHDLLFKRKEWLPSKVMRWQRNLLVPISIRKADRIVAISDFTKEDIEHYYPRSKGKIEVIHNSFNFCKFDGNEKADIPHMYFLAISTNADYKNQITIIKAFKRYCENNGDKFLVFVGKLSATSAAANFLYSLPHAIQDRILWKSHISNSELGALYRDSSCFISASKFEGLGMPVVEAMSFGKPVLLSDIPPHREVSLGKAEFFGAMDSEKLSEKMLSMDFSKREYSREIRSLFSETNTSEMYINLINRVYEESMKGR